MDPVNQNTMLIVEKSFENNGNGEASERQNPVSELSDSLKDSTLNANYDLEDEGCTAPFEILAEFLSALMTRDYKNAFHYCKLILQYEPENVTLQEFYPLIQQKIQNEEADSGNSEDSSETSSDFNSRKDSESSTEYYSGASNGGDVIESGSDSSADSLTSESETEDDANKEIS